MVDFNTLRSLGSESTNYELFVANTYLEMDALINNNNSAYTAEVGDVLCYDTADSDNHKRYDATIGTLVILGVIADVEDDETTPDPQQRMTFATNATCRYDALGTDNVTTDAQKLTLRNDLRAKNINTEE